MRLRLFLATGVLIVITTFGLLVFRSKPVVHGAGLDPELAGASRNTTLASGQSASPAIRPPNPQSQAGHPVLGPGTTPASSLVGTIAAFDHWLTNANLTRRSLSDAAIAEGAALARARRSALKQLIAVDPREALTHAISAPVRRVLPAAISAELEQPVDAFGDFEVVSICDQQNPHDDRWTIIGTARYATYTYGRRLDTLSKRHLAVHGFAIDNVLAMAETPYRALTSETSNAGSGNAPVEVQVGDTTRSFASAEQRDAWAEQVSAAEQIPNPDALVGGLTPAAVTAGWTVGEKRVLWIRAEFPDDPGSPATDNQITTSMAAVSTFYQDVSHGTCSFTTTIVPGTMKLTTTKAQYSTDSSSYLTLRAEALQLARAYDAANGGTGQYNPDNYDRYIVIFKQVTAYSWSGIATVGAKGLSLNGTSSGSIAAHELGHNHGLRHSHAWVPKSGSAIASNNTHDEYGDAFDDMGSGQSGNTCGHFNTAQKYNLGYLTDSSVQTVTQSGVYRIYRHDDRNASGVQALKISSSWAGTNYWFEYRHAAPYAGFATPTIGTAELPRLQNGIEIHWDHGPSFTSGPGTYLLDMTPTTTSGVPAPTDYTGSLTHLLDDSALALGESFNDPATAMTVTPVNVGGTSPNEWIDVYISLGAVTSNHSPTVFLSSTSTNAAARNDVTFSATGSDADGDTIYYHWDFGDGTIGPATATVTHQWLKGGTYSVTCSALDGRGGQSTTTLSVTVEDPLINWQRRAANLTSRYFYDVLFDGAQFVTVGPFVAAASSDGVTWTLGSGMGNKNYNYAVAYGNSRYVAVGVNGTGGLLASISSSTDGLTWVDESPNSGVSGLYSITYAAGRFVAVGIGGTIITSTDGLNWTAVASGVSSTLNVVRYGGGRFVAAGMAGTYVTSTDGVTWQNTSLSGEASNAYGLVYYQNSWLATSSSYLVADNSRFVT